MSFAGERRLARLTSGRAAARVVSNVSNALKSTPVVAPPEGAQRLNEVGITGEAYDERRGAGANVAALAADGPAEAAKEYRAW